MELTIKYKPNSKKFNKQPNLKFSVCRSTRQGCPLSSLLFLFANKPLHKTIHQSPEISGIRTDEFQHNLSLFPDEIVLFLTDVGNSIKGCTRLLETFAKLFGKKQKTSEEVPSYY